MHFNTTNKSIIIINTYFSIVTVSGMLRPRHVIPRGFSSRGIQVTRPFTSSLHHFITSSHTHITHHTNTHHINTLHKHTSQNAKRKTHTHTHTTQHTPYVIRYFCHFLYTAVPSRVPFNLLGNRAWSPLNGGCVVQEISRLH